jgi:hypothetical protein
MQQAALMDELEMPARMIDNVPTTPFSAAAVDFFVDGPMVEELYNELCETIAHYRVIRRAARSTTSARTQQEIFGGGDRADSTEKQFLTNLAWCFELWETPAVVTFDAVCAMVGINAEDARCNITREFGAEIRAFVERVHAVHPEVARHMKRQLRGYVEIPLSIH